MVTFDRIYFDTSVLIAANWPNLSAALERLLLLADVLKVKVFLPEAVQHELDEHWFRIFSDKCGKAKKVMEEVNKYITDIVENQCNMVLPDSKLALSGYSERVRRLKEEWKIETVPLTTRSLDELFALAVSHHAPFQEGDIGFKDAIIYLSVIDHLKKESSHIGAFISQDGVFKEAKVLQLAKSEEVSVEVYTTIDEVYTQLEGRLEGAVKRAWEEDRQRAEMALKAKLSEIHEFISKNLELSENEIGLGSKLIAIRGLQVRDIRNVQTPPLLDRNEGEPLKITFEVEIGVDAIVENYFVPSMPSRLKVGEQSLPPETRLLPELVGGPRQEERTLEWQLEAEAVVPPGDRKYEHIELVSVRSKGPIRRLRDIFGVGPSSLLGNR